jgi:hypothetical protein
MIYDLMGVSFSNCVLRFLTETQLEIGRVSQPPVATTPNMVVPPGASLGLKGVPLKKGSRRLIKWGKITKFRNKNAGVK